MRIVFLTAVFFAAFQQVFATVQTVAVLPSDGVLSQNELEFLTDKAQEIAVRVLPKGSFEVFPQAVVIKRLGGADSYMKECKESSCIVDLGRKASVDYVAQCRFGKLGSDLTVIFELYRVSTSGLIDKFSERAKNIDGLLAIMEKRIPEGFMKIPGAASKTKTAPPSVAGGISGLQSGTDNEFDVEQRYLANFATEPAGAVLSFNGIPAANCTKTPCSVELAEGSVRIIAVLDQYETADTTVSIKRNNQNINIKLKPNFGVLEIKPAYSEGIGKNENWSLTINGKAASSWENRLSPGKYGVKLTHRCYEDISFNVGINKGKSEIFDMGSNVKPKKGGLALSAEKGGKPVSEPVFVNGVRVGETPFSGSVAVCSDIEIGAGKEKVNVKLEHKQTVRYVHKIQSGGVSGGVLTDSRDGKKYRVVKIGTQTWMAENLNYNASGSKCYDNNSENCAKYGRLYDWNVAMRACPSGWHLPSKSEYEVLDRAVGGEKVAGKKRKARSGWNNNSNGTDEFGFSALPGGIGSSDNGRFVGVGDAGFWWSATEGNSNDAYGWFMDYSGDDAYGEAGDKSLLYSVRCLQDLPGAAPPPVTSGTSGEMFTDSRDGNKYRIVKIGRQTWMAENLNYNASGSKCYDNNPENCTKYGRLYDWSTAKKVCPSGWHLPSKSEYEVLDKAVGDKNVADEKEKLKAKSGWGWDGNGTDEFGFSALPGGFVDEGGRFRNVGNNSYWWSTNENYSYGAYSNFRFYNYGTGAHWPVTIKSYLFSVRCIKD